MHMVDALPIILVGSVFSIMGVYLIYEVIRARMAEQLSYLIILLKILIVGMRMGAEITNQNGLEKPILEIDNLTVLRSGKLVLKNVNLTVNRGEFVGIVGPNGSGKSTLLLTILGVLKAQEGNVKIYNSKPMSRELYGKIGWVSQAAANLPKEIRITVKELVHLGTINAKNMFSNTWLPMKDK